MYKLTGEYYIDSGKERINLTFDNRDDALEAYDKRRSDIDIYWIELVDDEGILASYSADDGGPV